MNKKIYIVLFIIIFGFLLSLLYLNNKQGKEFLKEKEEVPDLDYEVKEFISEERKKEIKELKKSSIYQEFPFTVLGWTRKQIVEEYGEPTRINETYIDGEHLHYGKLIFELQNEERICDAIILREDISGDVLGISVGMDYKEIEKILGSPDVEEVSFIGTFTKSYFFDNEGIKIIFIAYEEDGPIMEIFILWKLLYK